MLICEVRIAMADPHVLIIKNTTLSSEIIMMYPIDHSTKIESKSSFAKILVSLLIILKYYF
jgi:hypothetical protein